MCRCALCHADSSVRESLVGMADTLRGLVETVKRLHNIVETIPDTPENARIRYAILAEARVMRNELERLVDGTVELGAVYKKFAAAVID